MFYLPLAPSAIRACVDAAVQLLSWTGGHEKWPLHLQSCLAVDATNSTSILPLALTLPLDVNALIRMSNLSFSLRQLHTDAVGNSLETDSMPTCAEPFSYRLNMIPCK